MFDDLIREMDADILDSFGVPAVLADPHDQQATSIMVVIDRDVQVIAEDGYTAITRTHAAFNAPTAWEVQRGNDLVTANERFRLVSPITDDGSMSQWVVQKKGPHDLQDITDAAAVLTTIINEDW